MKIALCADEPYSIHACLRQLLESRGHEVVAHGAVATGREESWALVAEQAAEAVARGDCQEGIFLCWSGAGICMAANKVPGIRAAWAIDGVSAAAARTWNHANVLCLSHRLLTEDLAKEILEAWWSTPRDGRGAQGVADLGAVEARALHRFDNEGV